MTFALTAGLLRDAFTRKGLRYRYMEQAAQLPQHHWLSTVNNAKLWYLKPLDLYQAEKPYHINLPSEALGSHAQSNEVSHEYSGIQIQNLRGRENDFNLDRNGFQVFQDINCSDSPNRSCHNVSAAPSPDIFDSPDAVRRIYYPTIERLLKEKLGAQSARAFTHDVRLPPYRRLKSIG